MPGAVRVHGTPRDSLVPGGHVPCVQLSRWYALAAPLAAAASLSCTSLPIAARSRVVEFRPPSIVLAYPASGGALPVDKALVVFHFRAGEGGDPIDPTAFRATVDGIDRTVHFRVTPTEAWGQIADSSAPPGLTPGAHLVGARVCSTRGVCGSVSARIEVRPWERTIEPPNPALSVGFATPNEIQPLSGMTRPAGPGRASGRPDNTGA
jgi:hypothetical protein